MFAQKIANSKSSHLPNIMYLKVHSTSSSLFVLFVVFLIVWLLIVVTDATNDDSYSNIICIYIKIEQ